MTMSCRNTNIAISRILRSFSTRKLNTTTTAAAASSIPSAPSRENNTSETTIPPPSSPPILITKTQASSNPNNNNNHHHPKNQVGILTEHTKLVDDLLALTSNQIDKHGGTNLVAYSGGVDSSLVASLVYQSCTTTNHHHNHNNVRAVLGLSNAVPPEQVILAREVASYIGIPLTEIVTEEGYDTTYIKNQGEACLACKTHLYSALNAVAHHATNQHNDTSDTNEEVVLFNGTNKDDTSDPTRIGLLAAANFRVKSPLSHTTKMDVRNAARHLGLPNWNHAASPCLRSRLAFGVEATERHLKLVGDAERRVRHTLGLDVTVNVRVRLLAGNKAAVELDGRVLYEDGAMDVLQGREMRCFLTEELGFQDYTVRPFRTGSVAAEVPKERQKEAQSVLRGGSRGGDPSDLEEILVASV